MHKSRLGALVVDCPADNLFKDAQFWGAALGSKPESQEEQVNPRYIKLHSHADEIQILLQKVDHSPRVHIDIETDDIDAEVQRLQKLGAKIVEKLEKWVVMEAPSKHRFCVVSPVRANFEENATQWK